MQNTIRVLTILLALAVLIGACAPVQQQQSQQSPQEVQAQISTGVAQTMEAQNQIATYVAQTIEAQITPSTPTVTPTPTDMFSVPTITPIFGASPTTVVSGGGGGGGGGKGSSARAQYACSWREVLPRTNTFRAGEAFDVVWVITNTGSKGWPAGKDLDYASGPIISHFPGKELPAMKPGDSVTISFVATAPMEKGLYGMQYKVEGGLCWPTINIQVGK